MKTRDIDSKLVYQASGVVSDNPWYQPGPKKGHMTFRKDEGWVTIKSWIATGPVLGGNLETMLLLAGTDFWPDLEDSILYLEMSEDQSFKKFEDQLISVEAFRRF